MKADLCTMAPAVSADEGVVTVLSRCGASYNLTAEAAMRLSEELVRSAARARGQQRMSEPRTGDARSR
ncbi:hypothetical protein ASE95_08825 [Sphingomonas sp. Leaf231]|uniref:hypothetical protein n=1 Tax=Sphingomonas sp. Leaf231 TaxID=1736301 RepID=UPI0006F42A2A|nr:hypothetical protein [Sphingomonas sp. Leaf231]KQN92755.1 hypothetical protein ASE95_08825 [Sphingomonas sp. Leaf231]